MGKADQGSVIHMQACYFDPLYGDEYPLETPRWCSDRQTPLLVTPGAGISRDDIVSGARSLWRYRATLPVDIPNPISMGEGCTPMLQQYWGDQRPYFKLEWFNPTGSFKDRGASVMLSFLRQLGITAVHEDSSGNGGSAVAGFGACGGLDVKIIAPAHTSPAKLAQVRAYGAKLELVDGPREAAAARAIMQATQTFYASHNWHPFFLEGAKSIAYEIWEDFGFSVPDNIIMPAGAGSNLLGCAFGFRELLKAGQIARLPRLFVAQPLNCSPIDASFAAGVDTAVARPVTKTIAEGTAITHPLRLRQMIFAMRESGGGTVTLTEAEIIDALRRLARQGIFTEPTSATAAAALDKLLERGSIRENEQTVVIITGTGMKAASAIAEVMEGQCF
ncbi:threonine synthase [Sphingobium sp. PAMC28499]|uniref:threonine synthase n=1 Tax=Sphingobium sp. PAMC28499 TaxID=2565554 RepID=UPI001B34E3D8|nr:threonine synthase [Sphingobium sp. PAMC28499]